MRIGLEHIDPIIAAAMRARLCASGPQFLQDNIRWADMEDGSLIRIVLNRALKRPAQRKSEEEERQAYLVHRKREAMVAQRVSITVASAVVAAALLGMMFYTLTGNLFLGVGVGVLIGIGALAAGGYWAWQASSAHELFYEVTYAEFLAVAPLLTLTDVEAAYLDLLTRVCDHDPNQEARRAVRRHLHKLKEVVTLGRQLEALADSAAENEQKALQERIERVLEELAEGVHAITDALCTVLVVPSPAGDRAAERIETELETYRQAVRNLTEESSSLQPEVSRKRRREKVS